MTTTAANADRRLSSQQQQITRKQLIPAATNTLPAVVESGAAKATDAVTAVERSTATLEAIKPVLQQAVTEAAQQGASPLQQQIASAIKAVAGDAQGGAGSQLGATLNALLGVDVPHVVDNLSLENVAGGKVRLTFLLRDDKTFTLPLGTGEVLKVEVPRSPYGTALVVDLDIVQAAEAGEGYRKGEPILRDVKASFDSWRLGSGEAELARSHRPRILNPVALKPSGTSLTNKVIDAIKNALADVIFEGLTIKDGVIHLDAPIVLQIGDKVIGDFHKEAQGSLPVLNCSLEKLGKGEIIRVPAPDAQAAAEPTVPAEAAPAAQPQKGILADLLDALASVIYGGRWDAKFEMKPAAIVPGVSARPQGIEMTGHIDVDPFVTVRAEADTVMTGPTDRVKLKLKLENSGELGAAGRGQMVVDVEQGDQAAARLADFKVRWDKFGLYSDNIDVRDILKVHLLPWDQKLGPAPRAGSAAFHKRLEQLLGQRAPLHLVDRIEDMKEGDKILDKRLEMIDQAQPGDLLVFQTFILTDDVSGGLMVDALIAAKARGVDVKVLLDAVGCAKKPEELLLGNPAYHRLQQGGVEVRLHNPPEGLLHNFLQALEAANAQEGFYDALRQAGLERTAIALSEINKIGGTEAILRQPALALSALGPLTIAASELREVQSRGGVIPAEVQAVVKLLAPIHELLQGDNDQQKIDAMAHKLLSDLFRDHRKQLAVYGVRPDGQVVAKLDMGGNNAEDSYLVEPTSRYFDPVRHKDVVFWNDRDLYLEGVGVVRDTLIGFNQGWTKAGGAPVAVPAAGAEDLASTRGVAVRNIQHDPAAQAVDGVGDNDFTNLTLATLEGMGKGDELFLQHAYLLPIRELRDAIIAAADRGARLHFMTNGPNENNDAIPISEQAHAFVFPEFVNHPNIDVRESRGTSQAIHRKCWALKTASGKRMLVMGSHNFDELSAVGNRENVVVLGSAATAFGDLARADRLVDNFIAEYRDDAKDSYSTPLRPEDLAISLEKLARLYMESPARRVL